MENRSAVLENLQIVWKTVEVFGTARTARTAVLEKLQIVWKTVEVFGKPSGGFKNFFLKALRLFGNR